MTSIHKTKIKDETVLHFLGQYFQGNVLNMEHISGGESSQAFRFEANGEEYVVRVNHHNPDDFKKDEYAFKHFSSPDIVIPEVVKIGKIDDDYYFCISKKAKGETLENFSSSERKQVLPSLQHVLDKIHEIDVSNKSGYGKWDSNGLAAKKSWRDNILSVDQYVWGAENRPSLFKTTFLNQDMWEHGYARLEELVSYCTEDRYLVHGDAGSDNVLSDGKNITAIIDWADSQYGDFLLDVSRLIFWSTDKDYEKICLAHYANRNIANLNERILCYQIYTALNSLSFYAYSNQEDKAQFSINKLRSLIDN